MRAAGGLYVSSKLHLNIQGVLQLLTVTRSWSLSTPSFHLPSRDPGAGLRRPSTDRHAILELVYAVLLCETVFSGSLTVALRQWSCRDLHQSLKSTGRKPSLWTLERGYPMTVWCVSHITVCTLSPLPDVELSAREPERLPDSYRYLGIMGQPTPRECEPYPRLRKKTTAAAAAAAANRH